MGHYRDTTEVRKKHLVTPAGFALGLKQKQIGENVIMEKSTHKLFRRHTNGIVRVLTNTMQHNQ